MSTDVANPYSGSFIGKSHHFALRVYIEDTDLGGVVYHANYLRFLERARSDALRALEIGQRAALESGVGIYAVTDLRLKFCRPAHLEDDLLVISQVQDLHGARCQLTQIILRDHDLILDASVSLAFLSPLGRPKRQPPEWVEKLRSIAQPTPQAIAPAGTAPTTEPHPPSPC